MIDISEKYQASRVGFALDISDPEKMYTYYCINMDDMCTCQKQYWIHRISDNKYEMYFSPIDTTFHLFNKNYPNYTNIRIAGDFTMKHLPWYIDIDGISMFHKYEMYKNATTSSSIKTFIMRYMEDNKIIPIEKNNETILVKLDNSTDDHFWVNIFPTWEQETFQVFDKYLDPNKQFLDIGSWIGSTCIYASRKSSYVVSVEADPLSIEKLKRNIDLNHFDVTIDVEPYAVYNKQTEIIFGANNSRENSCSNDSMSQIKITKTKKEDVIVKTITFNEIIEKYKLNNLSLINIDIGGGEEYILEDVFEYTKSQKVPVYISFHYSSWNDLNLDRFENLTSDHKNKIINDPFCSILFEYL
jgi:FkbM family methyltransferase